jgi:hypothetical protein
MRAASRGPYGQLSSAKSARPLTRLVAKETPPNVRARNRARLNGGGDPSGHRSHARCVHPWLVAAAQQLGPLGCHLRGSRLRPAQRGMADDPETAEEANERPEVFADKTVGQIADHYAAVIGKLRKGACGDRTFLGGLLTRMIAGQDLAAGSVAIDAAPSATVSPRNWPRSRVSPIATSAMSSTATRSRMSGCSWGHTAVRSCCPTAPSYLRPTNAWRSRVWSWCESGTARSWSTTCTTTTWPSRRAGPLLCKWPQPQRARQFVPVAGGKALPRDALVGIQSERAVGEA